MKDQSDILKQLSVSIANQIESTKETDRLSRLEYDRKVEKDVEKKDSVGKLHSSVKQLFLMAASVNGKVRAADLPDSASLSLTKTLQPFLIKNWHSSWRIWVAKMSVLGTELCKPS